MRAALITEATCSAGAAIAHDLASHGWLVVLHSHRNADAAAALCRDIDNHDGPAHMLQADLTAPEAAADLIERAFGVAAGLELLVNNASSFFCDTARTAAPAALVECFSMNSTGPIVISREFARLLPPGRNGAVVNVLDSRVFSPDPGYFSFGVSQHATLGAMRMLALALAPRVRVNGVAHGFAISPKRGQKQAASDAAPHNPPTVCPTGGIAEAVRLIADSPAMTGTVIPVWGGPANTDCDIAMTEFGAP